MKILVASRWSVCDVIKKLQVDKPDAKVVCISVTDPKSEPVDLPLSDVDVLWLNFHDLDNTYPISGPAIVLFNNNMADQIKRFVKKRLVPDGLSPPDAINLFFNLIIVVHCEAGVSRSAGIAGALSKHFLGDDSRFFRSPYLPNRLVYRTLLNLLNGQENPIPNVILDRNFEENNLF